MGFLSQRYGSHLYQVERNHDADKPHPLLPDESFEGTVNAASYTTTCANGDLGVHGGGGGGRRRFLELKGWWRRSLGGRRSDLIWWAYEYTYELHVNPNECEHQLHVRKNPIGKEEITGKGSRGSSHGGNGGGDDGCGDDSGNWFVLLFNNNNIINFLEIDIII